MPLKKEIHPLPSAYTPTWTSPLALLYLLGIFGMALLAFHPGLMDFTLLPRFAIASFVFLMAAILICYKSLVANNNIQWPAFDLATGLLLSYFIWSTLSVAWAGSFSEAIFESQKAMLGFAAFYFCRWFVLNDDHFLTRLLKGLILVTVPILLIAGWQIFQIDANTNNALYELKGISGHKNLFSCCLFLLGAFLSMALVKLDNNWRKVAALLLFLTLLLILYLKTRSVYLGVAAVAGIYIYWKIQQTLSPKVATWLSRGIIALIVISVLGFLYFWLNNQLLQWLPVFKIDGLWSSNTGYERIMLWDKTACVVRQAPICGVGAGNWQIEFPNCSVHGLYSVETDMTTFQRPHNDWLWVWAETGIVGLFLYLGFFLSILKSGFQSLKKQDLRSNQFTAPIPVAFIVGFMIIACFSFPKERIELILLVFTLTGLIAPNTNKPGINSVYLNRLVIVLIIISASFSLFISQKRMLGEKNMKAVLVLKQQSKWSEMINAADRAHSKWYTIDPTSIPIHWYRGTANFIQGKKEVALQDFLKAEAYTPYNQHVQNDLGTCHELMGQKETAMAHYKEAIRISPLFDDPRVNIGVSYFKACQYDEALDWVNSIQDHELKMKYRSIIEDRLSNK